MNRQERLEKRSQLKILNLKMKARKSKLKEYNKAWCVYIKWQIYVTKKMSALTNITELGFGVLVNINSAMQKWEPLDIFATDEEIEVDNQIRESFESLHDQISTFLQSCEQEVNKLRNLNHYLGEQKEILDGVFDNIFSNHAELDEILDIRIPNFMWAENNYSPNYLSFLLEELIVIRSNIMKNVYEKGIDFEIKYDEGNSDLDLETLEKLEEEGEELISNAAEYYQHLL